MRILFEPIVRKVSYIVHSHGINQANVVTCDGRLSITSKNKPCKQDTYNLLCNKDSTQNHLRRWLCSLTPIDLILTFIKIHPFREKPKHLVISKNPSRNSSLGFNSPIS